MTLYPIDKLPEAVTEYNALENVYAEEIAVLLRHIEQSRNCIIQAPKHIFPYLSKIVNKKLETKNLKINYIDGRRQSDQDFISSRSQRILIQFETAVSTFQADTVFIVPYLDILTSDRTGGGADAREMFTLIHENPRLRLLAFEDPEAPLPGIVTQAFFSKVAFQGTPRDKLHLTFTKKEGRRFHFTHLPLVDLHRLLSGQSPIQIRKILAYISEQPQVGPDDIRTANQNLNLIRDLTLTENQKLSPLDLHRDIAGYENVKKLIQEEILHLLNASRNASTEEEARAIELLIPKGMIFHGPPGTGKTLFAQGIAHAIQGSIHIVNGPELKSKWVGQGEANIRRIFAQARRQAPSVIVFDEIDSIAGKRENSENAESSRTMVNQLLTEMDGFRVEDLVFVIGTTNLPELLDPALLRPGRFPLKVEIPYPNRCDRQAILTYWTEQHNLALDEQVITQLAGWSARTTRENTPFSGDHLRALIQRLKRKAIRDAITKPDWDKVQAWLREDFLGSDLQSTDRLTFAGVAGYKSLKKKLTSDFLAIARGLKTAEDWQKIHTWENVLPRALMFAGPPGTGKTHLAQALAGEWGASTQLISAPEILSQWVGKAEQNLRELFQRAKSNPPAVIIIDEIDALAYSRNTSDLHSSNRSVLLQLMTELSSLKGSDQVLVIGTTNVLKVIDPALLRPGRFGNPIIVDYPDAEDIQELIEYFGERYGIPLNATLRSYLESYFQGHNQRGLPHSPDDIQAVFQHFKRCFLSAGGKAWPQSQNEWEGWLQAHGNSRPIDPTHLRRVAVHEAGHVLVMSALGILDRLEEIRLSLSGTALGYVRQKEGAEPYTTESAARKEIAVDLGGRMAEILVFGECSSGCATDLEQATHKARLMAGRWGMGLDNAPYCYGTESLIDPVFEASLLPLTRNIIFEAEAQALAALEKNKATLEALADHLLVVKRLSCEDFILWLQNQEK